MKNIVILLLIILSTSCVTQRRCEQKFPPEQSVNIKDSINYKEVLVPRDTLIKQYVKLPDTTAKDSAKISIDTTKKNNPKIEVRPLYLKGNYSSASAWIYNNILYGRLDEGGAIELKTKITLLDKTITDLKSKSITTKEVKQVKYIPKLVKILAWIGGLGLLFILVYSCIQLYIKFVVMKINPLG